MRGRGDSGDKVRDEEALVSRLTPEIVPLYTSQDSCVLVESRAVTPGNACDRGSWCLVFALNLELLSLVQSGVLFGLLQHLPACMYGIVLAALVGYLFRTSYCLHDANGHFGVL